MIKNNNIKCFKPIINNNCEILILGSMPSVKSRENNFYYSNPTNRFWKILSHLYNQDFVNSSTDEKIKLLLGNHIALFDVYASCEMKKTNSSLDSDIKNQQFNNIPKLIQGTNINKIYITSTKAYKDFIKHFKNEFASLKIDIINLPSPSSANRSIYKTDDDLIKAWKTLIL